MVKYHEDTIIFQFNWNQVAEAFWHRYPNPNSTHVLSEDTISSKVKNGILYTTRLLNKANNIPKWGERFIQKINVEKVVEESTVDPKTKTLTTYTQNVDHSKYVKIVEKVVYKVCEDNPNWTVAKRSAWIDSHLFGLNRVVQTYAADKLKKHFKQMYSGFNYVLARMFPHTAQYMNPMFSQYNEGVGAKSTLAEDFQHSLHNKAEKVKDAAKKAKELAKKKAGSIYTVYQSEQS